MRGGAHGCCNSNRPAGSCRYSNRGKVRLSFTGLFLVLTMGRGSRIVAGRKQLSSPPDIESAGLDRPYSSPSQGGRVLWVL
jgi:hypothetical protein